MSRREPKNEQRLCHSVIRAIVARRSEQVIRGEPVDSVVRNRPAVEWIFETETARFAVEHTRIESFANQIAVGKAFAHLLEPLERELDGRLPGAFFLRVPVGTAKAPVAEHAAIRGALAKWILAVGHTLDSDEATGSRGNCEITATPLGVPFEVTLHRDCDYESRLLIMQGIGGDLQRQRQGRIAEALARKCPKLANARGDGCISILILESDDIGLANRTAIAEATATELKKRADAPDIVVWARTSTVPWKACFIKDADRLYPDERLSELFVLDLKKE